MSGVGVVSYAIEIGLRIMGVWPDTSHAFLRRLACVLVIGIFQGFQIRYLVTHVRSTNLLDLSENIAIALTDLLIFCKMIVFWMNSRSIRDLIRSMASDWKKSQSIEDRVRPMREKAQLSDRIAKMIVASYGVAVMLVGSGVFGVQDLGENHARHEGFLLKMDLPFDADASPNYEIIMIAQFVWQIGLALAGGVIISLMITSVLHVDGQIEILHQSLKEIPSAEDKCGSLNSLLKTLIEQHESIIELSKIIESVFAYVNFFEFLGITVVIGCVGFVIVISERSIRILLKLLSYYIAAIVDVFMYCLIGEYLGEKNNSISDAVYESVWYELQPKHCRYLLLLILRSQRRQTMTVGKFMDLSLECFTAMMKTSMSCVSLLNAIY